MTDLSSMVCVPYGGEGFALPAPVKRFLSRHQADAFLLFLLLAFGAFALSPASAKADARGVDPDAHAKYVALQIAAMQNQLAPQQKLPPPLKASWKARVHIPITAYSSDVGQTDSTPFITASGTHVRDGVVAANFLPIGTKVKIPQLYGDKVFTVEDRMNARYGMAMDIWMPDRQSAKKFGRKHVDVVVLK